MRIVSLLGLCSLFAFAACGGGDDASAGNRGAAGTTPTGGGPGNGAGAVTLPDGGTATVLPDGGLGQPLAPSGGGDPVGGCDAACTGTKMCNDGGGCVCAPGFVAAGNDCNPAPVSASATRTKAEVCARYAADTVTPVTVWKPGTGACDPGTVPYDGQVAALRYLNFYRWMLGVGPVQVVPAIAKAEQECAKILNYAFGHSPDPSTQCYTAAGASACEDSLIAGGPSLVHQFDAYAQETEQNLIHRRNVLSVGRAGVWAGQSDGSSAMHYGGGYPALASDPAFVAHPGPGPNVRQLVPPRWFVEKGTASIPAVDARVHVVGSGEEKPMTRMHHYNDFSSFDPNGWSPAAGVDYRVDLVDDSAHVVATFETSFVDCP